VKNLDSAGIIGKLPLHKILAHKLWLDLPTSALLLSSPLNYHTISMLRIKATVFQFLASTFVDTKGGGDVIYQNVDGENGPIRVLKYMPSNSKQDRYPVHIHLHGGGFVIGKADMDNALCRRLADETESAVISIDYAKAPQHPFPAALHDIRDVILSLANDPELDVSSLTIGGLSAGGNLSIAWVVYCLQNNLTPPVLLLPIYPPTDLSIPYNEKLNRVSEKARAKSLSHWMVDLFDKSYTDDRENILVSPGRAPATLLAKFPKTLSTLKQMSLLVNSLQTGWRLYITSIRMLSMDTLTTMHSLVLRMQLPRKRVLH
jgi:acetyl esterase/lipase